MADLQPNADDAATTPPVVDDNPGTDAPDGDAVAGSQPQPSSDDEPEEESAAQRRIRSLSNKVRSTAEERDYWRAMATRQARLDAEAVAQPPAAATAAQVGNTPTYSTDEVDRAFRTLKDRGMVTREELNEILLRQQWDKAHDANERSVREQGLPDYDRDEVEAYARQRGISDPMAAYRDMYFDEILDAARRRSGVRGTKPIGAKPSKPSSTAREPMTIESFREKLASSEGKEYYEKLISDPAKFDELLKQLSE